MAEIKHVKLSEARMPEMRAFAKETLQVPLPFGASLEKARAVIASYYEGDTIPALIEAETVPGRVAKKPETTYGQGTVKSSALAKGDGKKFADGAKMYRCMVPVSEVAGGEQIVTIEGLSRPGELSAVQQAFVDHTAFGCGYCTPGVIVTATAFLERNPAPTDSEIVSAMNDNLCRCASYPNIVKAIRCAADGQSEGED